VRLTGQCTELARDTAELETRTLEAASIETTLATESAALLEAVTLRDAAVHAADAAKNEAAAAASALQAAEKAWDGFARAKAAALEAAKEQVISASQLAESAVTVAGTKLADEQAEEKLAKARAALDGAERANAAAHAAHGLSAGDSCPVCSRALPAGFQVPGAADLDRAKQEVKEAEAQHREASRAHARAEAQVKHAQEAAEKAEGRARACGVALDEARADAKAAVLDLSHDQSASEGQRAFGVARNLVLGDAKIETMIVDRPCVAAQPPAVTQVENRDVSLEHGSHRLATHLHVAEERDAGQFEESDVGNDARVGPYLKYLAA
jgi:exonuclease SbcC